VVWLLTDFGGLWGIFEFFIGSAQALVDEGQRCGALQGQPWPKA
jgi:hypothetical protein